MQRKSEIKVRLATLDEAEILADMNVKMAFETENKKLDKKVTLQATIEVMKNPKLGYYLIAFDKKNKPIGTTGITYEVSPAFGGIIHWIQSVYVVPEARNKGCFRALYNYVVEAAKKDKEVKCVRLYADQDNLQAQAVYEKLGMTKMDIYDFNEADFAFSH